MSGEDQTHPSADVLADLSDPLADDTGNDTAERAGVRAHVEGCAECTGVLAALTEVRELLAAQPEPGPMPPHVAARLDAALAEEASRAVATAGEAAGEPAPTAIAALRAGRDRRTRWPGRLLQAAAAVVLVGAVGSIAVPLLSSDVEEESAAPAMAGPAEAGSEPEPQMFDAAPESSAERSVPAAADPATPPVLVSGRSYEPGDLVSAAPGLAAMARSDEAPADEAAPEEEASPDEPQAAEAAPPDMLGGTDPGAASAPARRLADPAALADCLQGLDAAGVGAGSPAVAVDLATYGGDPAAVVLFAPEPGLIEIVAVAPSCSSSDPMVLEAETASQ